MATISERLKQAITDLGVQELLSVAFSDKEAAQSMARIKSVSQLIEEEERKASKKTSKTNLKDNLNQLN